VVRREAERAIQRDGRRVRIVDVEHRDDGAACVHVREPRDDHRAAEARAVPCGVDRNLVDLAHRRCGVGMHLDPAEGVEGGRRARGGWRAGGGRRVVHEDVAGRAPRRVEARVERGLRPVALLGVADERQVVDAQPRLVVDAPGECAGRHATRVVRGDRRRGQRGAILRDRAGAAHAEGGGDRRGLDVGRVDPPVHVAAALAADGVEQGGDRRRGVGSACV